MDVLQKAAVAWMPAATSAPQPGATLMLQQRRHCDLQNLPIARDARGRSPLPSAELSLHSPPARASSEMALAATPKPADSQLQTISGFCHGRALQQEALTSCTAMSVDAIKQAAIHIGSIVACEGSPTARALCHVFPDSRPAKYSLPEAVMSALEARQVQRALLPVESSTHGSIHRTFDLLLRHGNVHIVGELVQLQLRHRSAAVGGEQDDAECGRFWVLSKVVPALPHTPEGEQVHNGMKQRSSFKTTVAMVLREGLGALHKALAAFAFRGIRVSKVESRPWRREPLRPAAASDAGRYFQYVLFIDIESSTASRAVQSALAQLQEHAVFLRLLGSYPCFHTSLSLSPRQSPRVAATLPVLPLVGAGVAA